VFAVGDYIRVGEETMYVEAINTEDHVGQDPSVPLSPPGFTEDHHNALTVTRDELPAEYPTGNTDGAIAVQHSKDAGVQRCKWWHEENIVDIVIEILHDYVGIDNAFIDLTGMEKLKVEWLSLYVLSALVTQPTSAKDLLEELCQLGLLLWWDEDDQLIKMDVVKPLGKTISTIDDDSNIIADSFSCSQDGSMRCSQIWLKFAQRNPALDFSKENMAACQISADLDTETADAYGGSQLMVIESRWIPYTGWTLAKKITSNMLSIYHDPPIIVDIRIDQKDANIKVGSWIRFESDQFLDADGAVDPQLMLVLEKEEDFTSNGGVRLLAMTLGYDADARYGLISDASTIGDYTAESAANQDKYAFICDASDSEMSNGDDCYKIVG
jgi:hypothetical protein